MFGQTKPAFGTATFGQTGTFGTTTPFGGAQTQTGAFGAKPAGTTGFGTTGAFGTQTQTGGGLFGSTQTSTASGGGLFGGATSTFGQATTAGTSFAFGGQQAQQQQQQQQTQQQAPGGLFGASTQANTSIFGTPTATNAFGAKTPGGFGNTGAGGGLFGQTGATGTTGLFGGGAAPTTSTTGGLFGGATAFGAAAAGAGGGTVIKFNPQAGTDTMMKSGVSTSISTRHQCITAMKEYENKSLEELRVEDYLANRKGPQAGGGMFGGQTQQTAAFGGFGTQNKPGGFGGFGQTTSTAAGGIFGQTPSTQSTSLFGGTTQNKPLFGTATTTASTGFGGFGTGTGSTLFGGNAQQKPGGLFGATSSAAGGGMFGNTQTQSTGFGASTGFGGFGATAQPQGGLFGNKPAGFGTPATSATGMFGQANPAAGGLFSKPGASAFNFGGNQNTGFGANTQAGGLFGNKPTGFGANTGQLGTNAFGTALGGGLGNQSSLFSGQANKPTLNLGQGFGQPNKDGFSCFGGAAGAGTGLNLSGNPGLGTMAGAGNQNTPQQAHFQQQLMALANSPYGDSPLFKNLMPDDSKRAEALKPTNPAAQKAALSASSQYKVSPRPTAKIKPKPIQSLISGKSPLFDGLEDDDSCFGSDTLVPRKSIKKLVVKSSNDSSSVKSPAVLSHAGSSLNRSQSQLDEDLVAPSPIHPTLPATSLTPVPESPRMKLMNRSVMNEADTSKQFDPDESLVVLNPHQHGRQAHATTREDPSFLAQEEDEENWQPHAAGIILRRPGYYTLPSLEELTDMVQEDGSCPVENFVVGREGYGNVFFEGMTDIAGLHLDEIVHFRRKEITIYPDDEKKPAVGEGLNKRAQVTLDCVWPTDKSTQSLIKDPERLEVMNYQGRIEKATTRIGAKFIDYRPETGSWVFEVKHFSKYGLLDDSDDEVENDENDPKKIQMLMAKQQQQLVIQKKKIEAVEKSELEKQKVAAHLKQKQLEEGGEMIADDEEMDEIAMEKLKQQQKEDSELMADDSEGSEDDDMCDITREQLPETKFQDEEMEQERDEGEMEAPSIQHLSKMGVNAHQVQLMKASFFADDDYMEEDEPAEDRSRGLGGVSPPHPQASVKPDQPSLFTASVKKQVAHVTPAVVSASPKARSFIYEKAHPSQSKQLQKPSIFAPQALPLMRIPLPPSTEHSLLPSGMTGMDRPRKVVGSRIQRTIPPLGKSLLYDQHPMLMDQGLFHSRSCRVGWGPSLTMVHCGQPITAAQEEVKHHRSQPAILPTASMSRQPKRLDVSSYNVHVEKISVSLYSTHADTTLKTTIEETLNTQLNHTDSSSETGCPLFVPRRGVDSLHAHAEQAQDNFEFLGDHPDLDHAHQACLVFDLCVALWGRLPDVDDDIDRASYTYRQARREALSRWLESASSKRIKREVQSAQFRGQNHLDGVLSHLTGRQISDACRLAQENGDHRLALLLAQCIGSSAVRQMLIKQLTNWEEQKMDSFIEHERLRIYSLMAGMMVWPSSIGNINVCEDLDWKRCLAVHLWYLCSPTADVSDALKLYDGAFEGQSAFGKYATPPVPPYLEDSLQMEVETSGNNKFIIHDMCYHILKLYMDRSHRLERLLAPTTSTANHLDYRLSWIVWQILQALEYVHLGDYQSASLSTSFAAQLENLGLWHWALFPLLHITDDASREHSVKGMLERHIRLSEDAEYRTREAFIQHKLLIPAAWIHEAKARRAQSEYRHHDEAWHLLHAGHWNESHRTLLRHVVPDTIINEDHAYLKKYLCEMSPVEYSSSIQDWDFGGKVFLDYITMVETLDEVKRGDVSAYELEKLEPEVTSLCNRIGNLRCRTAKDRLCQAQMAKCTANLLRTLLLLKTGSAHPQHTKHVPTKLVAPHICQLPMPEDYALQDLQDLTRSYMLEMTS